MAPIKSEVNGWELVNDRPGTYEYEKRVGSQVFSLHMTKYEDGSYSHWEMGAQGGSDAERLGGATHIADDFQEARGKAYCFMNRFRTAMHSDRGYNDVVRAADACGWEVG